MLWYISLYKLSSESDGSLESSSACLTALSRQPWPRVICALWGLSVQLRLKNCRRRIARAVKCMSSQIQAGGRDFWADRKSFALQAL